MVTNRTGKHCKVVSDQAWSINSFMEFYERVLGPKLFAPYGELLVREIRKDITAETPVERVLEVACGTGRITTYLFRDLVLPLNLQLVATDLSRAAVEVCKAAVGDDVRQNVTFLADIDMADLPFANDSFDIIVCGFGLMFPPDKAKVAREFKRVLRPGGKIYGTVFHRNQLFDLTVQQSERLFGYPSVILDSALSLSDHSPVSTAFAQEELHRGIAEAATLLPSRFDLDDSDTREFLFNACVLLEEFNQCDVVTRERYLDTIIAELHSKVPNRSYEVQAWLLRGAVDMASKALVSAIPAPDFEDARAFRSMAPEQGEADTDLARQYHALKAGFLAEHPTYDHAAVEALRRDEFARLDANHETYLDYIGAGIAPLSLLDHSHRVLSGTVFGNPHTGSKPAERFYESARAGIYRYFRCSPDDYEIIFTPNASAAIRLVAESFPFDAGSELILSKDNHTSVHGIREYAKAKGASVKYIPLTNDLRLVDASMERALDKLDRGYAHLLAFPAQSNATGVLHDLRWIQIAQDRGAMVLCDASAYAPLSGFDGAAYQPDFIPVSFYKIFGYPTGIGCLLAKKSSLTQLNPPAFAGGSVCYFSGPWSPTDRILYHEQGRRFEIGTPNYAAYHAVAHGFELMTRIGHDTVHARANALARWLETQLQQLRHSIKAKNALCRVYGAPGSKGATIMLNMFDCYHSIIPHSLVRDAAADLGITVRNGCFCNLGAVQHATYVTAGAEHCELDKKEKIVDCRGFDDAILSKGTCGAIRLSFGMGSTFRDAFHFYLFAKSLLNTEVPGVEAYLAGERPAETAS